MIQGLDFFYGGQTPRFLEQVVRAFSGFKYETGWRNGEPPQQKIVPCRLAVRDRMVAHLRQNASENMLLAVPLITIDLANMTFRRADLQNPAHVDTRLVTEREVDPDTGKYTGARGNSYMVERIMPLPFELSIQVDIWTSNMLQKFMLLEQILMVFCPDIDIQNSDNALDWTAKTMMSFEDMTFTSRTVPIGTENEIEVATLNFKLPMWLSPPAKVTRQRIVEQIVTNLHNARIEEIITDISEDDNRLARIIVTPGNHRIRVSQGILTLLGEDGAEVDRNGDLHAWAPLLDQYGIVRPAQSQIRLKLGDIEDQNDVVGTIQFDDLHPNQLFWQIDPDTLPANNLSPVDGIIDPLRVWPDNGLPSAATGQRYLVVSDVGNSTLAWGNLSARANDIIQFQNGQWNVSFAPNGTTAVKHVVNLHSSSQLRWTGSEWVLSIDGEYGPGAWRLRL